VVAELLTNSGVENAAIQWVMSIEREAGRQPRDVRYARSAGDIESPPRLIEVKAVGRSARGGEIPLEPRQFAAACENPNFYLYVVDNIRQGNPELFQLRVLGGEVLQRMLLRVKERRYYSLPWSTSEYDRCPLGLDC
jgi:hypothetical protein